MSEPLKDLCNKSEISLLHSLYRQAVYGDCNVGPPPTQDFDGVAKWKRWVNLIGMSEEEARREYIEAVEQLLKKYEARVVGE